jgi:hypothetical protein
VLADPGRSVTRATEDAASALAETGMRAEGECLPASVGICALAKCDATRLRIDFALPT